MKKNILTIGISIIVLSIFVWCLIYSISTQSCKKNRCLSFPLINGQKESIIYEDTNSTFRAQFESTDGLIRIEKHAGIKDSEAAQLTDVTSMKIQGLFENARSPYPGPLSDVMSCDNKYKPVTKIIQTDSLKITTFWGYANNRLQYGSCVDNQITHKGYNAMLYCQNHQSWYQIEILVPIERVKSDEYYLDLFKTISCQRPSLKIGKLFP